MYVQRASYGNSRLLGEIFSHLASTPLARVEKQRYAMTRSIIFQGRFWNLITVLVFMPCLSVRKNEKHSYVSFNLGINANPSCGSNERSLKQSEILSPIVYIQVVIPSCNWNLCTAVELECVSYVL